MVQANGAEEDTSLPERKKRQNKSDRTEEPKAKARPLKLKVLSVTGTTGAL